jgi:hypothetical protein
LFFRKTGKPDWRFTCAACGQGFGDDSETALQAIEITQNGLGNGDPPACACRFELQCAFKSSPRRSGLKRITMTIATATTPAMSASAKP